MKARGKCMQDVTTFHSRLRQGHDDGCNAQGSIQAFPIPWNLLDYSWQGSQITIQQAKILEGGDKLSSGLIRKLRVKRSL